MKKLLKEVVDFMLSEGEIDSADELEQAIFWMSNYVTSGNSKWYKEFKDKFFGESLYQSGHGFEDLDVGEVTVVSLDDEHIKLYAFDDSYEGLEIVLVPNNGKIEVKSTRKVDDSETNCYGLEDEELEEILES